AAQIVSNLLRNAIRHGCDRHQPRIVISGNHSIAGTPPDLVWLRVFDNGPGIPAEHREDIFLPGRRIPGRLSSGTGMALPLVRQIVEQYGGRVLVDPNWPTGTAILVGLPAADEG